MDEHTARRQADVDFAHEERMRAEAYAEGAAAERERCAKIVEEYRPHSRAYHIRTVLAEAIREERTNPL